MMTRSEAEIRKQVEARMRRWGLLALNAILWVGAAKFLYVYSETHDFVGRQADVILLLMIGWVSLVGLHVLRTIYVELREFLVRRAVEREREFDRMREAGEKRKHDDALPRLSDDGELIDFPEIAVRRKED